MRTGRRGDVECSLRTAQNSKVAGPTMHVDEVSHKSHKILETTAGEFRDWETGIKGPGAWVDQFMP